MVTIQDISTQLMKPPKDLADWKFPLAQILEEYYALLEEPCNINFGEAALVLQNSTNVYVWRIERLLNETEILKQTFYGYEEDEIKDSICKEENILKKTYIDFENFIAIDIEKDIGRHIDKKYQFHAQKKGKLLSHRFTQLENNLAQLCIPIPIYNVLGEIIGTKSSFRCNKAVSISGMLVDELIPCNVTGILSSYTQEGRILLSSYSEPKTPCTGTSGYHSITSPNDSESMAFISEEFENEENLSTVQNVSPTNIIHENQRILFVNINNSNQSTIKEYKLEHQHHEQCIMQNNDDKSFLTQSCNKANPIKKAQQSAHFLHVNQVHQNTWNNDNNIAQLENLGHKQFDYISKADQLFQLNELDNIQWKEGLPSIRKTGNCTRKLSICAVDDINEHDWKPMPLIQGREHVFPHNLPILKIPNCISVLKAQFGSECKKRKFTEKLCKPECIVKLILRETELFGTKDIVLRKKQKIKHLRRLELEDFMKNFDECFCGTKKENSNCRSEAVTDIAIDLLGLRIAQNQTNPVHDRIENITCGSSSPTYIRLESIISQNSLNITETPSKEDNSCHESSFSEINLAYSLSDYQTLIEDRMKEIFEESNVTTELDQTVAKWHASLQSKLSEAEIRPAFRIYDYASRIIKTLQTVQQKKITFDSVVRDEPACEVARYFLASLELANTYSVEIKAGYGGNSIEITLLNNGQDCDEH